MKYFAFVHFIPLVLLVVGSAILFRRGRNLPATLLLTGSCLILFIASLPLLREVSLISDFFGRAIERASPYINLWGGMIASSVFCLGFLLHAVKRTQNA